MIANEKGELVPIEDAFNARLVFRIHEADKKEYFLIPKVNRKAFNMEFNREYQIDSESSEMTVIPPLSILRTLCKMYGNHIRKSYFDKLHKMPIGLSTRGYMGYMKYLTLDKRTFHRMGLEDVNVP
jgi:hypothetical protein